MRLQTDTIGSSHIEVKITHQPEIVQRDPRYAYMYNYSRHQITTRHVTNTDVICTRAWLMLVQRRRRWANIKPASVERPVFASDSG